MKKANDPSYHRYYMPSANAVAPDLEEDYLAQPQPSVRPQASVSKRFWAVAIPNVWPMFCAFILAFLLVGQYIYIQNLGYAVSRAQNELDSVLAQNERLKQDYAAASSLDGIEVYALGTLGMIEPANSDVLYLSKRQQDNALQAENPAQSEEETPKPIKGIKEVWETIAGRIGF